MSQSPNASVLIQLASDIHQSKPPETIFKSLENTVIALFGYSLFTVLVYDAKSSTISRVYSTRQDVQPVGARKRVTSSPWAQLVLKDGRMYLGSTIEDMKVFSEYEFLATIGCESVLNVPIRSSLSGEIIGALALLGEPHKYDDADQGLAALVAVLVAGVVEASRDEILSRPFDSAKMETV
ncbi:hypothetical protein B0J15DRAFT_466802 [Fusarium solani]|jgi:transcriptional regulator with GAF, ATPase, and Fis domain|uniref:GAF domain-containing protein n=1 Tax=Fusarium solani TaxID=169388 RepID=A0A9P9H8B1_FUSSL|nr:uncharacterized protein B0J15DRAFT_466802 [Fusarium solani]KAH7252955.1 hypothetical protein B0J15DRAFT_466802 [Fusarium solani]